MLCGVGGQQVGFSWLVPVDRQSQHVYYMMVCIMLRGINGKKMIIEVTDLAVHAIESGAR